jgi:hypothetical protein
MLDVVQQEPDDVDIPVAGDVPVAADIPVVGHGTVLPDVGASARGLGVRNSPGGLRPPAPSSVEPRGIPTRPMDDTEPIPVGDEADAAGPAAELLLVAAQVLDAVPALPPPSNTEVEPDVPAADIPVPSDVPVIELPTSDVMPVFELAIEPPMPAHSVLLPPVDPSVGLMPGEASSVPPRGMPVGATGEPGPMPRGEVVPIGEGPGEMLIPPTCAEAEPQPKSAVSVTTMNARPELRRRRR